MKLIFQITTSSKQPPSKHTHAISTINGRILSKVANIPALSSLHSVTVMVVNLFYSDPDLLPERGFGYLIPRSIPLEQNPENALGVVFDSESSVGQDTAEGTKVSVMLGGHWWDSFSSYPSEEEGLVMAKAIMERHLKITNEPTAVNVALHKNCIPQYTVGHQARMLQAHKQIEEQFGTRLAVAGASYEGVGLNDCVQSGMITAADLGLVTGLQNFDPDVDMNKVMRGISGFEGKDTKD
jgi:oxygen-dependent protoporphyrinogen oxidase